MRVTKKRYTLADADEWGFSPADRCDCCGGKFYQQPIKDQSLCGLNDAFCSEPCSNVGRLSKRTGLSHWDHVVIEMQREMP